MRFAKLLNILYAVCKTIKYTVCGYGVTIWYCIPVSCILFAKLLINYNICNVYCTYGKNEWYGTSVSCILFANHYYNIIQHKYTLNILHDCMFLHMVTVYNIYVYFLQNTINKLYTVIILYNKSIWYVCNVYCTYYGKDKKTLSIFFI